MLYHLSADLVLMVHLAFVLFVLLGGFFVVRRPGLVKYHLPAAVWGALIEFTGFVCPLTPLEVALRELGGGSGYEGGFVEHYVTALLYPTGLTRGAQIALGVAVLLLNAAIYGCWLIRQRRSRFRRRG